MRLSLARVAALCVTLESVYAQGRVERALQRVRASEGRWWRQDSSTLARNGFWAGEPCAGERPTEWLVLWERTRLEDDADRAPHSEGARFAQPPGLRPGGRTGCRHS